jgi:phosphocarrier protein HPr
MYKRCKGSFIVMNGKGLHTRPSTELMKCATMFKAQVILRYQHYVIDAKSLLDILMLAATHGAKIFVEAVGEDAEQAVKSIIELAHNKFNIKH